MLGLGGRVAIAARGNGSGVRMLRYARPHDLNGGKFGRRGADGGGGSTAFDCINTQQLHSCCCC